MIQEQKLQNLADTLSKSGLACSPNEALRMAQNIMGTENKVAKNFDEKNQRIDDSLTRKRTYQEEVDYLIEKTSPEKKDFHIPIKGYRRDVVKEEPIVEIEEPPLKEEFKEVEEIAEEPVANELEELEVSQVAEEESEDDSSNEEEPEEEYLELAPEPVAEPVKESAPDPVPIKNELFDDDRSLKEIMEEDAKSVYKNAAPPPEPVQEPVQEPILESVKPEAVTNIPREKEDDFIGESVAQPIEKEPDQVQPEKPEQIFQEIKENKPEGTPPKKPIDDVDLMDYFKF